MRIGNSGRMLAVAGAWVIAFPGSTPANAPPILVAAPGTTVEARHGGEASAFTITSAILGETRRVDIVLPRSFERSEAARRYPVVVVLDGEFDLAPAAAAADELSLHGLMPECILVAVANKDQWTARVHDLTPPGLSVSGSSLEEGGDAFLDFIEHELLPAVDARFRGAPPRAIVGHSSGGILATWAAATRPGFAAVVAIDAPIGLDHNWLARKLAARETSREPGSLRYAFYSARFPWPEDSWREITGAAPSTWRLANERLAREGHETLYFLATYLGLREVFGEWSRLAAPSRPTSRILPYYDTVSASFGAPLVPPARTLRDVIDNYLMEGYGREARGAYEQLVAGYGAPADSSGLLSRIAETERLPPPAETVEGLLATPFPTPEEARPYLGEWTGVMWMRPEEPKRTGIVLRVEVVAGKVIAEIEDPDAPPKIRVQRMEYLKVTSKGLSFGIMNGMRPYGLILHEGTLAGDTLAGRTRWGGINFTYPAGMTPPDPGFSFTRVRR